MESSLTAPEDRDRSRKWLPHSGAPPLSDDALRSAIDAKSISVPFDQIERHYIDPPVAGQLIGLFSFVPAVGAKPNEKGIYGFAKLRGNYNNEEEAKQAAASIIKNVDSYHKVFHTFVGRPFPLTTKSDFSAEKDEIDVRREVTKSFSQSIKDVKKEDQQVIQEMQNRERELLEDASKTEEDPYEAYIVMKVKKAQMTHMYLQHQEKLKELKPLIIKLRSQIEEADEKSPEYHTQYFNKYMETRKKVGIREMETNSKDNFIKYMIDDVDLGF